MFGVSLGNVELIYALASFKIKFLLLSSIPAARPLLVSVVSVFDPVTVGNTPSSLILKSMTSNILLQILSTVVAATFVDGFIVI